MFQNRFSRHLTEAQILEETGVSWTVKLTLAVTILVTCFLLWLSALITVNEAVRASGEFLPQQGVQSIQSPDGGIVTEILVNNGQTVEKGTLLLRINNAVMDSEQRQVEVRLMVLQARAIRQEAFLNGTEADFSAIPNKYADIVAQQRAFLQTQNQVRQQGLWVFDTQISQKQSELELATQNLRTIEKNVKVNADLLVLQENLGKKKLVSHLSQLESKRTYLESIGKEKTLKSQIKQNQSALEEVREKKNVYAKELLNQANQELGTINNELSQVKTLSERMQNRTHNLDIYAPIHGQIQDSKVHTLGSVFNSRDVLMKIVPSEANLQLELQITPKDVGYVKPGQTVSIQVTSYDYNRLGGVTGKVISISPFTQLDVEKKVTYKGIVKLDSVFVGDPKLGNTIVPGMKAKADIISGSRSILSYILNPLTRPDNKNASMDDLKRILNSLTSLFMPNKTA